MLNKNRYYSGALLADATYALVGRVADNPCEPNVGVNAVTLALGAARMFT